ncbi:MAG: hypothetical protein HS111_17750 [Kofleriaceae bacterium]|nr:hypothetical protein [Kofleriaceae bacterium]MCL4224307.1 hypothetical protein [Myxococcales bacterium]
MLRPLLLTAAVLALAGSATSAYTFDQEGTVAAPRAASHDGQPLDDDFRIEGHAATTTSSTIDRAGVSARPGERADSGAAVARNQAGLALRRKAGEHVDVGLEVDGAWGPTRTTRDGAPVDAPDEPVLDVALAVRASTPLGDGGSFRIGWAINAGAHQAPIRRDAGSTRRDAAFLFRAAMVPSLRRGVVTLFGSFGVATETDVPASVFVSDRQDDPGVVHDTVGVALTVAAGAAVELGSGARVTARVGDALSRRIDAGHYGPQVDVGLAFDLGK